jgi:hypothetical protein
MRFQSFFMLITVQSFFLRLVVERLREGADLAVGQARGRAIGVFRAASSCSGIFSRQLPGF